MASEHDLVLLFKVKQGCVEIDLETLMDESSDAALVEVSSIKRLNTAVRGLGTEKVSTMREMKEFKSKIHATNWETECLDFRAGEVMRRPETHNVPCPAQCLASIMHNAP